jgi:hypothetical protein
LGGLRACETGGTSDDRAVSCASSSIGSGADFNAVRAVRHVKHDPVGTAGVVPVYGSVVEPAMTERRGWTSVGTI